MFDRKTVTVNIEGQELTLKELSAKDFSESITLPEEEQGYTLVSKSIASHEVTPEDVMEFPNKVATQILEEVLKLNGVTELGN